MENNLPVESKGLKSLLSIPSYQQRFKDVLKDRAPAFITSILSVGDTMPEVAQNNPITIIRAAAIAASLDLPIDKSLGFAWIVPYKGAAQFQMGYKGFVQLGLRTGQYLRMNCIPVAKNQFKSYNRLTEEFVGDFGVEPDGEVVGFVGYFKLVNGFEKTIYKSKEELVKHGKKYSQSFEKAEGTWKKHEDAMCLKTLIKMMLSKWGIMSTEMRRATIADQAVVTGDEFDNPENFKYPDNAETSAVPAELPVASELTARQKFEVAKAQLFAKKGRGAVDAIISTMSKDIKDYNDVELSDLIKKMQDAASK
jgi:recombination protein RecT